MFSIAPSLYSSDLCFFSCSFFLHFAASSAADVAKAAAAAVAAADAAADVAGAADAATTAEAAATDDAAVEALLLLLKLLLLLYNICRVPGFEPEILRPQTVVLPIIYTHPLFSIAFCFFSCSSLFISFLLLLLGV